MTEGVRARRRAEIEARLLEVGRRHLATEGAAALSVRGVARDLGMAPSALFRYISGRDELLTLLIVDGYTSLADAVDAALEPAWRRSPARRWEVLAHAVRDWALTHPHQWSLLYGSPVPDYAAPEDLTTPAGTRVQFRLLELGAEAVAKGVAAPAAVPDGIRGDALAGKAVRSLLADPTIAAAEVPPAVLANGLTAWMLLVGAVSTEVFEGFGADAEMAPVFDYVVAAGHRILFTG